MPTSTVPPEDIITKWHTALTYHPDLAQDLRACRSAILNLKEPIDMVRLPYRIGTWLTMRYANLWETAPPFARYGLCRALELATVHGAWAMARAPLLEYLERPRVLGSVFADALDLAAPWRATTPHRTYDWTECAELTTHAVAGHLAIVLLVPRHGADLALVSQKLTQLWDEHVTALVTPPPGSHGSGDLPDWDNNVTLYRLWRQWERDEQAHGRKPTYKAFARQASGGNLPIMRAVERLYGSEARVRPRRIAWLYDLRPQYIVSKLNGRGGVIKIYGPEPSVPTLAQYLADTEPC